MNSAQRLLSLDVFRGITIAGMILVNNPGTWSSVYPPLLHAEWHGCTPTDLVFPFFLFIVGVAIALALSKRKEQGVDQGNLIRKILIRVLIIFGLGVFLAAFPKFGSQKASHNLQVVHYLLLSLVMLGVFCREVLNQKRFQSEQNQKIRRILGIISLAGVAGMLLVGIQAYDLSRLRIPGVLQRIALVYGCCALLFLKTNWKTQLWVGLGCLLFYWGLMTLVPVPGGYPPNLEAETNIGAWFDRTIFGNHLWVQSKTWDPEGLFSTIPAVATGISGVLTGLWLRSKKEDYRKVTGILAFGAILVTLGLTWDLVFPINKKIWTSSYVLYTSGIGMLFLGVVYWLVDILGYKRWTKPFVVYGMNALFAYILSGIVAKLMIYIKVNKTGGEAISLKSWFFADVVSPMFSSTMNASLLFAILNVLLIWAFCWILYRNKIFIKV